MHIHQKHSQTCLPNQLHFQFKSVTYQTKTTHTKYPNGINESLEFFGTCIFKHFLHMHYLICICSQLLIIKLMLESRPMIYFAINEKYFWSYKFVSRFNVIFNVTYLCSCCFAQLNCELASVLLLLFKQQGARAIQWRVGATICKQAHARVFKCCNRV